MGQATQLARALPLPVQQPVKLLEGRQWRMPLGQTPPLVLMLDQAPLLVLVSVIRPPVRSRTGRQQGGGMDIAPLRLQRPMRSP